MRKELESHTDGPALVVTYGNTTRRHRPLEGDLVVLGRARSCDVALVSPEVAPVHCLIARTGSGWRLRDCTGRGGTRLNGEAVTAEVPLNDGDVLQVGTFSFEAHLPAARPEPRPEARPEPRPEPRTEPRSELRSEPPAEPRPAAAAPGGRAREHLKRSRRNLAELALALRQKLHLARAALLPQEDLDHQADRVRTLQRECESRKKQHEQAEATARAEREARDRDLAERRGQLEQAEQDLAARLSEAESRLQARHSELGESQRRAEEAHERRCAQLRELAGGAVPAADSLDELHRCTRRLARFARKLRAGHQKLQEQARELAREQPPQAQGTAPAANTGEVRRLEAAVAELRQRLAAQQAEAEAQQKELEVLRSLEDAQAAFVELSGGAEMQSLIASLRKQVKDRDELLEKMNEKLAEHARRAEVDDVAAYEAELNGYRVELERDRREMNDQMAQLQERHRDMEDALREAELQMARERAQIAREQAELNRLRMELSRGNGRGPGNSGARRRLAGVTQLKEELAQKRQEEDAASPNAAAGGRLRNLLNRLTGSSA
jgi:hypothetical protein